MTFGRTITELIVKKRLWLYFNLNVIQRRKCPYDIVHRKLLTNLILVSISSVYYTNYVWTGFATYLVVPTGYAVLGRRGWSSFFVEQKSCTYTTSYRRRIIFKVRSYFCHVFILHRHPTRNNIGKI